MRSLFALVLVSLLISLPHSAPAYADDGIPDNCEYTASAEQKTLFPRYSASTHRLVLVSWNTGEEVRMLAEGVQVMRVLGWSADCRYLAVAEGTPAVMNTVVYDTTTSQRMGSIDDAHQKPHPITWGYDDYLVVETRTGAILWHVPTGERITLTDSYNTTTGRNFSRLRWDGEHGQLIADLAVGGRIVYDLATGQVVPVAAPQLDARIVDNTLPQIVIGGREYPCRGSFDYGYRGWFDGMGVPDVFLHYDVQNGLVGLQLNDPFGAEAIIQTLEDGIDASYVVTRGWSPTCRYIAASLGIPGQDASDTVIYDVIEGGRVGVVPDARHIPHPLQWGSDGKTLLVQTRHGGILWDLATNTQTDINDAVEVPLAGQSGVRNFSASAWSDGLLLAAPVDAPNTVVAYDSESGEGRTVATFDHDVKVLLSGPGGWGIAGLEVPGERYEQQAVFFRADGAVQVDLGIASYVSTSNIFISPDGRYFVMHIREGLAVWNTATGSRTVYQPESFGNYRFVDNVTLQSYYGGATFNVETGVYMPATPQQIVNPVRAALAGEDGEGHPRGWWQSFIGRYDSGVVTCAANGATVRYDTARRALVIRSNTGEVLVPNLNTTQHIAWSPDCRKISASVSVISTVDLPYDDAPLDDIYRDDLSYDVTFWDATTSETLGAFPRPYVFESPARVDWSPGSERAFVRTTQGYFIFDPATRDKIPLHYAGATENSALINTGYTLYWDFTNGRLFVTAWGGALVFDLRTGERIAFLMPGDPDYSYGGCEYGGCSFRRSDDGRYLYVYGTAALAQYDFLTLQGVQVDVDNSYSVDRRPTATSPDGRYLVVANMNVRVWDVANLAEPFTSRDPVLTFAGPEGRAASVAFVDSTILAITTYYGDVTYWNVETGEQTPGN